MAKSWTSLTALAAVISAPLMASAQTINLGAGGADQIWHGTAAGSKAGISLDLGDVSGDNRRDLIIGAPGSPGVFGAVYVIYGGPVRNGSFNLSSSDAVISGPVAGDLFGFSTAAGNVFNLEGATPRNVAIGAPNASSGRGAVYVFSGGFGSAASLSTADARLTILGAPGDRLGTAMATGDLDGDGYREIIIGAPGNDRLYIIRGGSAVGGTKDLSLTPTPADRILSGTGIGSVLTAGEVTGDGIYDLLVGRPSANFVYLFAGAIGVLPTQATATYSGGDPGDEAGASLRVLDVDADGLRDLLIGAPGGDGPTNARTNAGEAHILWGGSGLLASRDLSATADVTIYGGAAGMAMGSMVSGGDINRDTPNDIVLLAPGAPDGGQMYIFYGRSRSQMGAVVGGRRVLDFATTSPSRIIIGDNAAGPMATGQVYEVTGEGARDLIVGVPTASTGAGAVYFTTSPKMVLSRSSFTATVMQGQTASAAVTVSNPSTIGMPFTVTSNRAWLTTSPSTGNSTSASSTAFTITGNAAALAAGTYTGTVTVTSTTPDLTMSLSVAVTLTVTPAPAPPGESGGDAIPPSTPAALDADGRLDLVWQNQSTGEMAAWNMDGSTMYDSAWLSPASVDPAWKIRASADLNRDGKPDLIWQHTAGWLAVWFMNGTAVLDTRLLSINKNTDPDWVIVGAADMNNDLRADIIWQHRTRGDVAVWLMWDNMVLDTRMVANVNPVWRLAAVGDLTRDNNADFVFQHTDGTLAVWFMRGLTVNDTRIISRLGDTNWQVRGLRDINNDLRADLVFQHQTGGWVATWFMWDNAVLDTRWITPNRITDLNWKIVGIH